MKKDRNCGMQYMGGMPMMPMPNYPVPNYQKPNYQMPTYQDNEIINQLNNLEKRVAVLENMMNTTHYNNSNYQMM